MVKRKKTKKHWIDRTGKELLIPLTKKELKEVKELEHAVKQLRKAISKSRRK
jgi:hypothetical protein